MADDESRKYLKDNADPVLKPAEGTQPYKAPPGSVGIKPPAPPRPNGPGGMGASPTFKPRPPSPGGAAPPRPPQAPKFDGQSAAPQFQHRAGTPGASASSDDKKPQVAADTEKAPGSRPLFAGYEDPGKRKPPGL